MSQVQVESSPVAAVPQTRVAPRRSTVRKAPPTVEQCLIVSPSERWATKLSKAASGQGWEPIVCVDAEAGMRAAVRNRIGLAIVDLASCGPQHDEFKELAEMLARESGALLMVCGHDGDAAEEIWARQLGVWAYLPEVDDGCDVQMLCGEAKLAATQLQSAPGNGW